MSRALGMVNDKSLNEILAADDKSENDDGVDPAPRTLRTRSAGEPPGDGRALKPQR
jgi:hypothetical protein